MLRWMEFSRVLEIVQKGDKGLQNAKVGKLQLVLRLELEMIG